MFGTDVFILELRRFGERLIEYFIEAAGHIYLTRTCALNTWLFFQIIVEFLLNGLGQSIQFIQDGAYNTVFLAQKTNQKMFRFNGLVAQSPCKGLGILNRFLYF